MTDNTYNGWTNYTTWRVNLEYFYGDDHPNMTAESAREFVEDCMASELDGDVRNSAVFQYASVFLDDVNWDEIADAYADDESEEDY